MIEINDSLRGRDFISIHDFTSEEIRYILQVAHYLKNYRKTEPLTNILRGKLWV